MGEAGARAAIVRSGLEAAVTEAALRERAFEGERIKRFRQYWDEVALLEGLGPLPED